MYQENNADSSDAYDGQVTAGDTDRDRFTDYTYDAYGRLSSVTGVNGTATGVQDQTTLYYYADTDSDPNNDDMALLRSTVTETAYPDSTDTSDRVASTYDNLGRLLTTTDQRNLVHTYTYDAAGRLATDSIGTAPLMRGGVDGAVRTITYGYDAVGRTNLVTSLDVLGAVVNQVAYTYDGWGNLASEQQSHSGAVTSQTPVVRYTYDDGASAGQARYDRLASVTYPDGRQVFYRYGTTPATATRVDAVTNGAVTGTTDYEAYTYFGLSTVVLVNRPLVSGGMKLQLWTGSGAIGDQLGRTSDTKWTSAAGTTVFDWFSYGYDANSNMLYRKNNLDAAMSELYQENNADPSDAYDGLDRLVTFSRGTLSSDNRSTTNPSRTQSWNLDGQDNWASVTTNSTTQDLAHNAANEIASTGFAYDAAGNLTSDGTYTYTYDGWNRLVKVETVGGTPETVATYAYDGQNHRISKTAGGVTTEYYYDAAWRVVEERQGGQTTAEYIYGLQTPDVPIARIANGQTLFYCTDATGKVTSLVDGATHTVVERYVYDPYGAVTFLAADWSLQEVSGHADGTASAVGNAVLYAGYRYDAETALYNLRHREYHPTLGRFLERDPVGYSAGSMNLYGYASADPIGRGDPMGLCDKSARNLAWSLLNLDGNSNGSDGTLQLFGGSVIDGSQVLRVPQPKPPVPDPLSPMARQYGKAAEDYTREVMQKETRKEIEMLRAYAAAEGRSTATYDSILRQLDLLATGKGYLEAVKFQNGMAVMTFVIEQGAILGLSLFFAPLVEVGVGFLIEEFVAESMLLGEADAMVVMGGEAGSLSTGASTGLSASIRTAGSQITGLSIQSGEVVDQTMFLSARVSEVTTVTPYGAVSQSMSLEGGAVAGESASTIISRTAQAQADLGANGLRGFMTTGEQAAYIADPARGSRFLGTAVHRATDSSLQITYPGRFAYSAVGPDFTDTLTGEVLELTTPGQVGAHTARYGPVTIPTYRLP